MENIITKICKSCNKELCVTFFNKQKKGLHGVRTQCKECTNKTAKEYKQRPDVILRSKQWYQDNKSGMRERLNEYYWTLTSQFHNYKKNAQKKNIAFELTKKQCEQFYNTFCYYCNTPYKALGIDRIDNTQGYFITNVRPCCKWCNFAKNNRTEIDFYNHIKAIAINLNLIV